MPETDFLGRWEIYETGMWRKEDLDLLKPAHIVFGRRGSLGFILVSGDLDHTMGRRGRKEAVEFTWEGNDEMDPASGRGWAT